MGDHRDVSYDSRGHASDPGRGTIPESQVVGRAFVVVWPLSRFRVLPIPQTFNISTIPPTALGLPRAPRSRRRPALAVPVTRAANGGCAGGWPGRVGSPTPDCGAGRRR